MASAPIIDLRSDFLSRPTQRMLDAMNEAAVAPGGFGLREDHWQLRLEADAAALLGKEDALLFPTCTMANQAAVLLWTRPGDTVVAANTAHIFTSEAGAPSALAGVTPVGLPNAFGDPALPDWEAALAPPADAQRSPVSLCVLENTHNRAAGNALTADYVGAVSSAARAAGARLHMDGSRIFNAALALNERPERLAAPADSVSVSLNKGLGAPMGAILAGPADFIADALRIRQMLGGGIRPASAVAAAGWIALREQDHLQDDHRRAERLRRSADAIDGLRAMAPPNPTNIVILHLDPALGGAPAFCRGLAAEGVLALPFGRDLVRFVTYRDINDAAVDRTLAALQSCARGVGASRPNIGDA